MIQKSLPDIFPWQRVGSRGGGKFSKKKGEKKPNTIRHRDEQCIT